MPPGLLPNEAAGTCRPRTSIQPPRAPVPTLVNPAPTWQPVSRIPGTSGLWQNHCGRDRIHDVKGVCGLRPSMPRAMSSVYGAMTGRQRHGGPVRRHAVMFGKRAKTAAGSPLRLALQGEAHRLPSTESQTIGTTRSFAKNRTWSIDIRPARTKLSRCRAASDWVPANQPGPPGYRPATLSRR